MSIPRLAIERPVTMFMISMVIILLGAISLTRLPVDLMPDTQMPTITVRVNYTGVGPLEMEELVTRPIEQAVSAVAGLERVDSTSAEGNANVRLNFAWGTDLSEAADEVRTRLDRVRGRLPEDADPPTVFKFDSTAMPIMGIGVEGDFDPVTLRELAQNDLSPRLERVAGVAAVTINGGLRRQIRVDLSREKLTALNLSPDRVIQILRTENQNIPLGEINDADRTLLLRSPGQFINIEEIRNIVVMTRDGVPVYMRDIAEVRDTTEDRRSFMRINGVNGIRMQVTKQSGTNTIQIAEGVKREVARINSEVDGIKLQVLDDQSRFIQRAIGSVQEHAMIGGLLVIAIIYLFLRDFKSTMIICTSIPVSVIGTFALLYFGGYTLNTLTFGGLALGIGMIVDAAIVVLENTYRHLEMGKDRMTAAIDGSEEVWSAILASTLTHIAVFVPMLFLTGVSSIMFGQLAAVVSFSLAMSLLVAVTIVPVLCSRYLDPPHVSHARSGVMAAFNRKVDGWLNNLDAFYARMLHLALAHRPTVFATGFALFAIAMVLMGRIGFEFQPQTDEGEVQVDVELAVGSRIERTEAVIIGLEERIRQLVPEAIRLIGQAGGGGGGGNFGGGSMHRGSVNILLVPRDERDRSNEQIAMSLRRELSGIPGVIVRARPSGGQNNMMRGMGGGGGDGRLSIEILGHDLETSKTIAQDLKTLLDSTPGIADTRLQREEGRPELAVRVDRDKAALLGLTVTGVANTIRTNVAGTQAAMFRDAGNEYPIIVRLRESDREEISEVGDVLLSTPSGQVLPAKNVMVIDRGTGPVSIERKNQERVQRVNAETEVTLSEAVEAVQARLNEVQVPRDFAVGFGNEVEEQNRSFRELQLVLILAIVLVYTVMASQYESLRDPFIIIFSIPLAAIGVVGMLMLTGTPFSMQAYIGVIMLAGIVVSNAILLVDYTNTLRHRDGMELRAAIELAGRHRLRPILMTSLCTALGLVPMALGVGEGAELQAPLARVVIGGLLTSTLITLVFVPAMYTLFEEGWRGIFKRGPAAPAAPEAAH
ncbi:MAG TPA: efflux RND transporter permease subunit [Vicinamibacterales bacterium]|nr:efflux RND transporter permease subunit [Vicinamibacterales bacterium]